MTGKVLIVLAITFGLVGATPLGVASAEKVCYTVAKKNGNGYYEKCYTKKGSR